MGARGSLGSRVTKPGLLPMCAEQPCLSDASARSRSSSGRQVVQGVDRRQVIQSKTPIYGGGARMSARCDLWGVGQRGAGAREHVGRQVAAHAVVAAEHERQQALAGTAGDVEDAADRAGRGRGRGPPVVRATGRGGGGA